MKWILWLLWDPLAALDLNDANGRPDHGKVAGFFFAGAFIGLIVFSKLPTLGHTIAIIACGFGSIMFRTFLKAKGESTFAVMQADDITGRVDDPDAY